MRTCNANTGGCAGPSRKRRTQSPFTSPPIVVAPPSRNRRVSATMRGVTTTRIANATMPQYGRKNEASLRIVAGSLRGSRIVVPPVDGLRPTADRVRETVFNWLAPIIDGARCLDLFAGTGALGIEAVSRGAAACVFVERDRTLAAALTAALTRLKVDNGRVVSADAGAFVGVDAPEPFDIAFLDPPFDADLWTDSATRLERHGWLRVGAHIHVEAPLDAVFEVPVNWSLHREGRAGAVRFALYRRHAPDPLS
jgi:16S rRNA (guanine966-N2)-methyltransferase